MATKKSWHIVGPSAGAATTSLASVPGIPIFSSSADGSVSFTVAANSNGDTCEYAIQCAVDGVTGVPVGYLNTDGDIAGAETWQTAADWGSIITASLHSASALVTTSYYQFQAKARNEAATPTAFSEWSSGMIPYRRLARGPISADLSHTVYSGNTHISRLTLGATSKAIPVTFTVANDDSTASRVTLEFMRDGESSYTAATDFFTISASNSDIVFTSSEGTATITTASAAYATPAALATALQTAMNADNTLTGTGTITFAVSHSSSTGKYTIDAGVGNTISLDYFNAATNGAYVLGFNIDKALAQTITSDESRGEAPKTLSTSTAGTAHTVYWDTKTDLGSSYNDSITVRVTPYDASPTGGDADTAATVTGTVNNLPLQMTALVLDTGATVDDKDTTPTFRAVMSNLVLGDYAFFIIYAYDSSGTLLQENNSAETLGGWEYETAEDTWAAITVTGVSAQYLPPNASGLRVRYTYQTALATGVKTIRILQAELFSETV